jgi:hypothetical protein|nr:MAG TPA: hypothetical protein [Caudoviricetes sp.]
MNFTVSTIAKSLADYLRASFPGIKFLEDPNQQGTKIPCMFLQQRYSNIKLQTGGRWLRTIGLDLTYLEDYNLTNMQELYQAAAETLDLVMEMFPYSDGTDKDSVFIRTYEREWRVDLDAMHYKFEIRELVTIPKEYVKMQTIQELNEEVKTIERK